MPRRIIPLAALGLAAAPALAQGSPPLLLHPVPRASEVSPPDAVLIPPAVFGGPGYGLSGHGYFYDGPGEGPLVVPSAYHRRGAPPRAAR